jgi:hypothetical protein
MVEDLAVLAGSAAVIAFMLGVAALLGFRRGVRLADDAQLAALIADAEPGARLDVAAIGEDGRAALARLSDGRYVAAQVMGDRVSLRIFSAGATLRRAPGRLSLRFADLGFPSLHLRLKQEPAWLAAFPGGGKP